MQLSKYVRFFLKNDELVIIHLQVKCIWLGVHLKVAFPSSKSPLSEIYLIQSHICLLLNCAKDKSLKFTYIHEYYLNSCPKHSD